MNKGDKLIMESIEHLSREDLVEIVKDVYAMNTNSIEACVKSAGLIKIRILEYLKQEYIMLSMYLNPPPPDTGSNGE